MNFIGIEQTQMDFNVLQAGNWLVPSTRARLALARAYDFLLEHCPRTRMRSRGLCLMPNSRNFLWTFGFHTKRRGVLIKNREVFCNRSGITSRCICPSSFSTGPWQRVVDFHDDVLSEPDSKTRQSEGPRVDAGPKRRLHAPVYAIQ